MKAKLTFYTYPHVTKNVLDFIKEILSQKEFEKQKRSRTPHHQKLENQTP